MTDWISRVFGDFEILRNRTWFDQLEGEEIASAVSDLRTLHVAPSQSWGYDSAQAAIDAGESAFGSTGFCVFIHEELSENTVEVSESNVEIRGRGTEREGIGDTVGININAGGAPGIRYLNNNAPAGGRVENLVIGGASGSPAIEFPEGAINFVADIQAVDCGSAFRFGGGSSQENDLTADARDVDVGLDLDFSSDADFFNQNEVNLDVAKYSEAGIRARLGGESEFGTNTFYNFRIENADTTGALPMDVTGTGYFKANVFMGYGVESAENEWVLDADNMGENEWRANITPNSPFTGPDMDIWRVFTARSKVPEPTYSGIRTRTQEFNPPTTEVGTSSTTIATATDGIGGGLYYVNGDEQGSTERFYDLIHYTRTQNFNVVNQIASSGAAGRTYSTSAGDLQLAMSSGTYDVVVGKSFAAQPF